MNPRAAAVFAGLQAVASPILIVQADHVMWANAAAASLTGYDPLDLQARSFSNLIAPRWRALNGDRLLAGELELLTAHGNLIWVEVTIQPAEIDGETLEIVTLADIRVRKQLEQTLSQRESTYRRAIEANLDGFYLLQSQHDASGKIVDFVFTDVNAPGEAIIPATKDKLIGRRVTEIFPHERGRQFLNQYIRVVESGQPLDEDFELIRVNGSLHWYHHQVIVVKDGVAVFIRDITERKATEAALRESEHRYRALFDQANDYVTLIGLGGHYLLVNQQFASALGYPVEKIVGRHIHEFMSEEEIEKSEQMQAEIVAGSDIPLYDRALRRHDGSEILCEVNVALVRDSAGDPLYIQSILRDVTWRRETENALRESEARYRLVSELISDYAYAFRIEPDGTQVQDWVTESFTRITGFAADEINIPGNYALFHPDDRARVAADVERVLRGETVSGEYRIVTKSGALRWLHILRHPIWDAGRQHMIRLVGVAQDITERKQAEEELRTSEAQYRLIAENASDMITRTNLDGTCTYASSACRTLLGYEPDELLGQRFQLMLHPDDKDAVIAFFRQLVHSPDHMTITCRVQRRSGEYGWFEITAQAVRDADTDQAKEYVTVTRDISQRKEMEAILLEQERLRYELQKEQELNEVKSNLMRTISHEFRTPLALIVTASDMLDQYGDRYDAERRSERFQAIRVQVKHLSEMLDDITFVVQGTLHHMAARPSRISLEAYCREIVEEIQTSIGKTHRLVFTTDGQLVEGIADKALIVRIVGNLLSNAVKYSPDDSTITVGLFLRDGNAVLEVSDQGIGIQPDEMQHIFEPFYRGNSIIDTVGGTGLGLGIVKDCVNLHGGTITVDSEPGKGTTFVVRLPQTTA